MKWVCSDHHAFHHNILLYEKRPFRDVDHMNYEMIRRHNEVVKPDDIVYHLGDFCFGGKSKIRWFLEQLNGRFTLVLGNHDKGKQAMLDCGFDEVYEDHLILRDENDDNNGIIMSHRRMMELPTINVGVDCWNFYPIPLPTARGWYHLVGHSHSNWLAKQGPDTDICDPEWAEFSTKIWRRYEQRAQEAMENNK